LNLTLQAREARGVAEIQWASIAEAHQKIGKVDTCLLLVSIYDTFITYISKNS